LLWDGTPNQVGAGAGAAEPAKYRIANWITSTWIRAIATLWGQFHNQSADEKRNKAFSNDENMPVL